MCRLGCMHCFHTECLQQHWGASDLELKCPTCQQTLAKVHQDTCGNCFIGFDTPSDWIACYTLVGNKVKTVHAAFPKWKRQEPTNRLEKIESINIRSHIIVS